MAKTKTLLTGTMRGADEPIDGRTAYQELAALASTSEYRIASQRRTTGQALDAQQTALLARHDALIAANAAQARAERPDPVEPLSPMRVYLPREVLAFVKSTSDIERRHGAMEHRARVFGDTSHPYWNESSPEHKAAVLGMKVAAETITYGNAYSVKLGADGSVEEN